MTTSPSDEKKKPLVATPAGQDMKRRRHKKKKTKKRKKNGRNGNTGRMNGNPDKSEFENKVDLSSKYPKVGVRWRQVAYVCQKLYCYTSIVHF